MLSQRVVAEALNASLCSLTTTTYSELAQPEDENDTARMTVLSEDLVSSRVGSLELKLDEYCRISDRKHTVRNVLRQAPWLSDKSGSALTTFMDTLEHGLSYLRFVGRFVGNTSSRLELRGSLPRSEVALATFLAHVLKCLGCVPQFGQDGRKQYLLPLGLDGVVKKRGITRF